MVWKGFPAFFQAPPGSQASSRGEAKDSALLSSRDAGLLEPPERTKPQFAAAAAATKLLPSCPTLCDPIDGSPPGSPVPGILQSRILKCVAMPSSMGSSQPRDQTEVSCIAGSFFTVSATREALRKGGAYYFAMTSRSWGSACSGLAGAASECEGTPPPRAAHTLTSRGQYQLC